MYCFQFTFHMHHSYYSSLEHFVPFLLFFSLFFLYFFTKNIIYIPKHQCI
ncbi:uncharacterized protein DS421_16g548150 [Arachis hypogaea]|nr:uncharacterized protein DS421_16g548150 [Arachis hypogaea]